MDKIRILLADDMEQYRKHFISILKNEDDFDIAGEASSGKEAVNKALELKPDVILMDIQMEHDKAGICATEEIIKARPETKIIILTIHGDDDNIFDAYDAGVCDFILKTSTPDVIICTIRDAMKSEDIHHRINYMVASEMVRLKKERNSFMYCVNLMTKLSKGELEILKMLCEGKKYREIADERFVSESTVRVMVNKISKKFGDDNIRDIIKQMKANDIYKFLENFTE